jgi:hypothetical protein
VKKLALVIPIMILVAILAMWMLGKEYADIELPIRILISVGAALLSGVISYFLFAFEKENKI